MPLLATVLIHQYIRPFSTPPHTYTLPFYFQSFKGEGSLRHDRLVAGGSSGLSGCVGGDALLLTSPRGGGWHRKAPNLMSTSGTHSQLLWQHS
jgi:hypothetical protein